MTTLVLIRHGQASFGQENYDRLSEVGEKQAEITGRHLVEVGAEFDAMLSGEMDRQKVTGERAREAWPEAPELAVRPAFNEYDANGLFRAYLPQVLAEDSELAAQQREMFKNRRLFQRAFMRVTRKWLAGEPHEIDGFEPWADFRQRVADELAAIHRDHDRDARIAVFTSGGPIAVSVGAALNLSPEQTIELNWRVFNAAITELHSTRHGWALQHFNDITHLRMQKDPKLITHR
jgi:broad specificity phosphatase PhoE